MNKIIIVTIVVVVAGILFWKFKGNSVGDYKNTYYNVEGRDVLLINGEAKLPAAPDSASMLDFKYFGNEAKADFNGDGLIDKAFILTLDGYGSGTFYYIVASLQQPDGKYIGTKAIFLGDRIAPKSTEFKDGVIIVNYADRKPEDPMTTPPSVGVSKYLKVEGGKLVEVNKPN